MGIPRFTSYVDNNFTGWLREEVKGNLVIDGFSLCYHLYSCDWSHGGQYSEYRNKVAHCFISMGQSGITPIVVMDGVDYKEEKVETVMKRRNNALKTIHKHTSSNQSRKREVLVDGVLPPLTLRVFIMVMQELKIKFIVADGEGDCAIYELANMYSCPVLSRDSDFLMFKLKGGYIPLNRFHWEAMPINAEVYYYHAFCSQMKFNDPDVRLLVPAIVGNDFLAAVDTEEFVSYMAKQAQVYGRGHHNPKLSTIVRYIVLFNSLDHFVERLQSIPCLSENVKDTLRENCALVRSYDSDKTTTLERMNKVTELRAFNSEEFPDWILRQFRFGNMYCMEALVLGKYMHDIFIDNTTDSTCSHSSMPIRQYIYGLTGYSLITEYGREGQQLVGKGVHANTTISGHALPNLSQIPVLSSSEREHLLYSILGCADDPQLLNLPEDWKLAMAATKYWVSHCSPSAHQIKAMILNFVVYATCPGEVPNMHLQFEIPLDFLRSSQWMPMLHKYSQWQSVYADTLSLNQLLMLPLLPLSPAQLYDGRLVLFFAYPENEEDFLASRLPIDQSLYAELLDVVLPKLPMMRQSQRRSSGGGARGEQPPRFRGASSPHRGRSHHQRGRGRGHRFSPQAADSFHDQVQAASEDFRPRGSGFRRGHASKAMSPSGHAHVRGRGKGPRVSNDDRSIFTSDRQDAALHNNSSRNGRSSRSHHSSTTKGAASRSSAARAQVAVSEQPKFTHKNRFSALVADESSTSDESASD